MRSIGFELGANQPASRGAAKQCPVERKTIELVTEATLPLSIPQNDDDDDDYEANSCEYKQKRGYTESLQVE